MFGIIDSPEGGDRPDMSKRDGLFDREVFLDVLVNAIPLGILLFFVVLFVTYGSYPGDVLVVFVQMSLIVVPAVVLLVLTYYAARAVTRAEREGDSATPPGYSRADAEVVSADDD
jgi:cation transporter-like permease